MNQEQIKILLVDDELPIREWLEYSISSLNRDDIKIVGVCRDGREARDVYFTTMPDICITDIKMPNMNGIELLKIIKAKEQDAYVVMLTSHDDFELARESLKHGAVDYVLKNEIDSEALNNIINDYLDKSKEEKIKKFVFDDSIDVKEAFNGEYHHAQNLINDVGVLNNDQVILMAHLKNGTDVTVFDNLAFKADFIKSGRLYKYGKNKVVFIVDLKHSTSHMDKYNYILLLSKEINELSGSAVGSSELLGEDTSIENAVKSSLYALGMSYYDKRPSSMYTARKLSSNNILKGVLERRNSIVEMINVMSFEKAEVRIGTLFDYLKENKFCDVEAIKLVLIDFVISFKLSKSGLGYEELGERAFRYQEKIHKATNIYEMERTIEEFIGSALKIVTTADKSYSKYVIKAIAYIYENYTTIKQIKEISDYLGLNLEYFCRLFKSDTKETPNNYLTNQRIKVACHLLKTSDLKVNEIGEMIGYNSLSYFSRSFRKKMMESPYKYRSEYISKGNHN